LVLLVRYQKNIDTIVEFEKMGRGVPLISFFPERFEIFTSMFGQYMRSKSNVLMHMIEDKIGGKDSMRNVLNAMVKSPNVYAEFDSKVVSTNGPDAGALLGENSPDHALNSSRMFNSPPPMSGQDSYSDYLHSPSRSYSPRVAYYDTSPMAMMSPQTPFQVGGQSPLAGLYSPSQQVGSPFGQQSPYKMAYAYGQQSPPQAGVYGQQSPPQGGGPYGQQSPGYVGAAAAGGGGYGGAYGHQSPYAIHAAGAGAGPYGYGQQSPPRGGGGAGGNPVNPYANFYHYSGPSAPGAAPMNSARSYGQSSPASWGNISPLSQGSVSPRDRDLPNPVPTWSSSMIPQHFLESAVRKDHHHGAISDLSRGVMSPSSLVSLAAEGMDAYAHLSCESISLDTFISSVRAASQATSTLDEAFLDAYVGNCGASFVRFGVFLEQKVDNKPHNMCLITEQIAVRFGEINNAKFAIRDNVRVRIAEVREDLITEPAVPIGPHAEQYQQRLHARPGRKSGKKREEMDSKGATAQMQSIFDRRVAEREAMRDLIQVVRDMDNPIRYAVIEPQGLVVSEVHVLSGDVQLIEQLYADIDTLDVLRQVQAVRSIARADPLNIPIVDHRDREHRHQAAVAGGRGNVAGTATATANAKKSDKIAKLQVRALFDTLMGSPLNDPNLKSLVTGGHSLHVRIEAAFALAQWQNERAPTLADTDSAVAAAAGFDQMDQQEPLQGSSSSSSYVSSSSSSAEINAGKWGGLAALLRAIRELYVDPESGLPVNIDLTKENSMHLRNAMLLAVAGIRALNGVTPHAIVRMLLLFVENHYNEPISIDDNFEVQPSGNESSSGKPKTKESAARSPHDTGSPSKKSKAEDIAQNGDGKAGRANKNTTLTFDDSHVKATLLLALSKVRTESFTKSGKNENIWRIVSIANRLLAADEALAKSIARTNSGVYMAEIGATVVHEPVLPLCGVVAAAAIVCLSTMDVQAIQISSKKFSLSMPGCYYNPSNNTMGPTGTGIVSGLNYVSFFAPPDHKFTYIVGPSDSLAAVSNNISRSFGGLGGGGAAAGQTAIRHMISSPAVRIAALEGFISLCLMQGLNYADKVKREQETRQQQQLQKSLATPTAGMGLSLELPSSTPQASQQQQPIPALMFVCAMFEAVCYVIDSDRCRDTRELAAQTLLDCVQDRAGGRAVYRAMAFGEPWLCAGYADPSALTIQAHVCILLSQGRRSNSGAYRDVVRNASIGADLNTRKQVSQLWNMINVTGKYDQAVRSCLLTAWITMFGPQTPLFMQVSSNENNQHLLNRGLISLLGADRLKPKDPIECTQKIEMVSMDY
jgi:hypothetical protein